MNAFYFSNSNWNTYSIITEITQATGWGATCGATCLGLSTAVCRGFEETWLVHSAVACHCAFVTILLACAVVYRPLLLGS